MNRRHEKFKRLFALFLVLVMLATSGNGYSMSALAAGSGGTDETQQTTADDGAGTTADTPASSAAEPQSQTQGSETQPQSQPQSSTEQSQPQPAESTQPSSAADDGASGSDGSGQNSTAADNGAAGQTTDGQDGAAANGSQDGAASAATTASETQPASEAQSEAQSEQPADNGIMTMDAGDDEAKAPVIWNYSTYINKEGTTSEEILSGETFDYVISYNVPPLEDGSNYQSMQISLTLTQEQRDRLSVVAANPGEGTSGYMITGRDVNYVIVRGERIDIILNPSLTTGSAGTVTIKFKTDNMEWENGSTIRFSPSFTGSLKDGTPVEGQLNSGEDASVTVLAQDGWKIEKSVDENAIYEEDGYYYVPYTVKLINTDGTQTSTTTDRLGRLNVTSPITIEDIFPEAYIGQTDDQGNLIGYPDGGAAAEVINVQMDGQSLQAGTDYTYTAGTGITFNKTGVAASDESYIPAGTPVNTTYTYTVKYPAAPYLSPSNIPDSEVKEYFLENTANLSYTLLGQSPSTDQAEADIVLGEKDENGDYASITVKKVVSIGDKEYPYSSNYGTVSFELYRDENCTLVAYNYDGTIAAGAEQTVNANGEVTFEQLSKGQTYYLKEIQMGAGLTNEDPVVALTLNEDRTVTVEAGETTAKTDSDGKVKVVNDAASYGHLEFYKYGKDSEGQYEPLENTEFTLTSQDDSSKVYTAVSGADGRVFFEGIPEGDYILKETSVKDADYEVDGKETSVTIQGDTINHPDGLPNLDNYEIDSVEVPVYLNVSPKGKFQFIKVDSTDPDKKLAGARFELYGPYETANAQIKEEDKVQYNGSDYILVSDDEGNAVTSIPLTAGYYIMQEIQAPDRYVISGDGQTVVQVTANKVNENVYSITNVRKLLLNFRKTGTIEDSSGATVTTEQLSGAVFEVYADPDGQKLIATLETRLDAANNSQSYIQSSLASEDSNKWEQLYLEPGTYYYKEIKAPDGYIADSAIYKVELDETDEVQGIPITNSANFGMISLVKVDAGDSGKKLSGAVFGIYKDQTCNEPVTDSSGTAITMTTDSNGEASARVPLDGGSATYYVKEIKAPEGYAPSADVYEVKVEKNKESSLGTVKNQKLRSLVIKKTDSETGQDLSGATFALFGPYDSDGLSEEEKANLSTESDTYIETSSATDTSGECMFTNVEPGKWYYIKEVQTPAGYVPDDTVYSVQIKSDTAQLSQTKTITNVRYGKLVIAKTTNMDAADGTTLPLPGVEFKLYKAGDDGLAAGDPVATGTTGTDGKLSFDNLEPGEYILRETTPEGYNAVADKTVTVTAGLNQTSNGSYPWNTGNTEDVTTVNNTTGKGRLELDKVSSESSTPHIEATFNIYKDADNDGRLDDEERVDNLETITTTGKANDYALSGWLEPGTYFLVETAVADGYMLDDTPKMFEITAAKTTRLTGEDALTNQPQGTVKFHKVASFKLAGAADNTEPALYDLTGSILHLYKKTSENAQADINAQTAPEAVIDLTTSAQAVSELLDPVEYWIVEVQIPEDYKAAEGVTEVTIGTQKYPVVGTVKVDPGQSADTAKEVVISNYTDKGKLRINKYEYDAEQEGNKGDLLDGAQFKTYIVCNSSDEGAIQIPGTSVWVKQVFISGSTDAGGEIMESGTDGEGSALSIDIEPGIYYIREISLDKVNQEYGPSWYPLNGEWAGPFVVEEGQETIGDFFNYQMTGPGVKEDKDGNTLPGSQMVAFASRNDASEFLTELKSLNVAVNSKNKADLIKNLTDADYLAEWKIVDVSTMSDEHGRFTFDALQPGGTYYIAEAVPPDGYGLNYKVYDVKVKADGSGFEDTLTIVDYKLGRLSVKKTTTLNGETFTVEGVTFNIYRAVQDVNGKYKDEKGTVYNKAGDAVASGTSKADGIYTSVLLEAGMYIVEEVVPKGSPVSTPENFDDTYAVIEIKAGEQHEAGEDAAFNNPAAMGKFVLKKVDSEGHLITDSTIRFQLYKRNQNSNEWEKYGEEFTAPSTGGGIYESGFLPVGSYRLVETSAPGYTIEHGTAETGFEFTIASGKITGFDQKGQLTTDAGLDDPIILTNNKKGSLTLLKVGMFGDGVYDGKLEGVTFGLYKDEDCTERVGEEMITDENGRCTWDNLDAGTYYLKELGAVNGKEAGDGKYTINSTVRTVTIGIGEDVVLDDEDGEDARFENDTTYGKFKIKKVDANDNKTVLSGALFKVYTNVGCTIEAKDIRGASVTLTTGSDGTATSPLLPAGTYYLKEIAAPDGYALNETPVEVEVKENQTTDATDTPIENVKLFSITLTKKITGSDTPLAGAVIGLYDDYDEALKGSGVPENPGETGALMTVTSADNGSVTFSGLEFSDTEKTYYIREISAPAGYDVNETVYEVSVSYITEDNPVFTIKNREADEGVLYNDALGTVTIHKVGSWKNIDSTSEVDNIPLAGAEFNLYKVGQLGEKHAEGAKVSDTLTTSDSGSDTSIGLEAGWYELVETKAPEGYAPLTESLWVKIENNNNGEAQLVTAKGTAVSENKIENDPDKAKFVLYKYDGSTAYENPDQTNLLTGLEGAVFKLERYDDEEGWVPNNPSSDNPSNETFTMTDVSYESGYLEPGWYRITETQAPTHTWTDSNNVEHTITFELDPMPQKFLLAAGETLPVKAYNSPNGSLTLTKYGQDGGLTGTKELLSGATFALYTDEDCEHMVAGSEKTTVNGEITWDNLAPGTYWVKETETGKDAVNNAGYGISDDIKMVTIYEGALVTEVKNGDLNEEVTFINQSNAGKIRILKKDALTQYLSGAEFKIYAKEGNGWAEDPITTLTITNASEGAVSILLPADPNGTEYKIVETKAPDGYTLDRELSEIERIVTVYPVHSPSTNPQEYKGNCFVFENRLASSVAGLDGQIYKKIREAGAGDDETAFTADTVTASESLLLSDYTVEFELTGYGTGNNEKPVKNLTVTDNNIVLQYIENQNSGSQTYTDLTPAEKDYTINSVTVRQSNNNDANEPVGAQIYVQKTLSQKENGIWELEKTLDNISGGDIQVSFNETVLGVKVVYTNTLAGFTSGGLVLNVTFKNRGEWSTKNDHEVRRIINKADISWDDTYLDASGNEQTRTTKELNSNEVKADIPTFENKLPEVQITTEITDSKQTFYSTDEINFRVTGQNMSADGSGKIFRQPVISFKLPALTYLDETAYPDSAGFVVTKILADGQTVVISPDRYKISEETTLAALSDQGGDNYDEDSEFETTQYIFEFEDDLEPQEKIVIEFKGSIGNTVTQKTISLVIPGYLSSTAKIPVSAENPLGLSFLPYNEAPLYDNAVTDDAVDLDLSYVNDSDLRSLGMEERIQLEKYIGVKDEGGTINWLSPGQVAQVNPADEIYYLLRVYNLKTVPVETAKIVDIFPCENDTYVLFSNVSRGTDIPLGEGYEGMTLLSVDPDAGADVTVYTTEHNWSQRSDDEKDGILQPLYYKKSNWSSEWSEGINPDATALGMEIDFTQGGTTDGLASNSTYDIVISMRTPGYTADKISEYYGRYMDNSAAVAAVEKGADPDTAFIEKDMAEPNRVRATLALPTGSIGDYVWFDDNLNGIQDEDEEPVEGMDVELWQTRYYEVNGQLRNETRKIAETQTDQDGKYLFTGLACQYLVSGAPEGSQAPSDYIGGEYYTYQVRFVKGEKFKNYTFTQQYASADTAVDSNASLSGETENITLSIVADANGRISGEENLTIDAGLTSSYALGDYVWLDTNCNGVQDADEQGVPDVPVFLYKVDSADGQVADGQNYLRRTTTDQNGYYLFDNLMEGYYVVEFDISNLQKLTDDGYTYRYDFTVTSEVPSGESGNDSDARFNVDADGRIRRTNVITLTEDELQKQGIYDGRDLRWDAGLVVYSAIGGFVFDDQDYDDLQSLYIPLEGTIVELYEIHADGSLSDKPVATQTVGSDGTYFFDHLFFDTEYKDYSVKFIYPEGYYGVEANADGDKATSDPKQDSSLDSDVNGFDLVDGNVDRSYGFIQRIRLGQDTVTTTWDAGARKYSTIGDYIWIDADKDGIQDSDEKPVEGIVVILQSRKDNNSPWEYEKYTVTDENGRYEFTELESSDYITKEYRVVFNLSETTQITTLNSGNDSSVDSDAIGTYMSDIVPVVAAGQTHEGGYVTTYIKPGYGETDLTWDAGIIFVKGAVGDYVWYDDDHNGIQDENEKGVANVPVVLEMNTSENGRDNDAWVVVGETVTDENGYYIFENLDAGYYRVRFQIPEDYVNTRYNRGTGENGDEIDSDASRETQDRWYYTSNFYLEQGERDMTWDAGIYMPKTRTEVTTDRRPIDRVTTERVTRNRTIRRTRTVRTGENTPVAGLFGTAVVSLGVIGTILIVRRRKKGNKNA